MKITGRYLELLSLVAISGDFPKRLISRLKGNRSWNYRVLSDLLDDKYIRHYKKDGIASIRLTAKSKKALLVINPLRFNFLLNEKAENRNGKSDFAKRHRLHMLASSYVMMDNCGIPIYRDLKPDVFANDYVQRSLPAHPVFYSSLDMKADGLETVKIKSTRSVGIITTPEVGFYVYNTGNALIKFSSKAERRLAGVVEGSLLQCKIQLPCWEAIVIGSEPSIALKILNSNGGKRQMYLRLDGTFSALYFVPENMYGEILLELLCNAAIRERLRQYLLKNYKRVESTVFFYDAVSSDNTPVLFAHEFNLEAIRNFRFGLEQFQAKGIVIGFDFQKETLQEYFGSLAEVLALRTESVVGAFFYGT